MSPVLAQFAFAAIPASIAVETALSNGSRTVCVKRLGEPSFNRLVLKYLGAVLIGSMWIPQAAAGDTPNWELRLFTHENQNEIAEDAIGLRLTGVIPQSLAKQLRDALLAEPGKYNHVVVELDSEGGEIEAVKEASATLREVARTSELTTRVLGGGICASGCVALFMQGQKRKASGASAWIFHGACGSGTNIPSLSATIEYLDLLTESGVDPDFTCSLVRQGYVTSPGNYFLSGFELYHHHKSNIITELLPAWQAERPYGHVPLVPR